MKILLGSNVAFGDTLDEMLDVSSSGLSSESSNESSNEFSDESSVDSSGKTSVEANNVGGIDFERPVNVEIIEHPLDNINVGHGSDVLLNVGKMTNSQVAFERNFANKLKTVPDMRLNPFSFKRVRKDLKAKAKKKTDQKRPVTMKENRSECKRVMMVPVDVKLFNSVDMEFFKQSRRSMENVIFGMNHATRFWLAHKFANNLPDGWWKEGIYDLFGITKSMIARYKKDDNYLNHDSLSPLESKSSYVKRKRQFFKRLASNYEDLVRHGYFD